jgi:hypothetical protein
MRLLELPVLVMFGGLFFTGLLAGMELALHVGVRGPAESIAPREQLVLRQALVLRLRILVPAFFLPAALLCGASFAVVDAEHGLALRVVAATALGVWIVVRVVGTVPINSATLEWKIDDPPSDWRARVARAERFHIVGLAGVVVAFGALLAATALA